MGTSQVKNQNQPKERMTLSQVIDIIDLFAEDIRNRPELTELVCKHFEVSMPSEELSIPTREELAHYIIGELNPNYLDDEITYEF